MPVFSQDQLDEINRLIAEASDNSTSLIAQKGTIKYGSGAPTTPAPTQPLSELVKPWFYVDTDSNNLYVGFSGAWNLATGGGGGGGTGAAIDVTYDNTASGLTAANVQAAIDEIAQTGGSFGSVDGYALVNDINSPYNAVANYGLLIDTTDGQATVILPTAPAPNSIVRFIALSQTYATNKLNIQRNGQLIGGIADDVEVTTNGLSFDLVFVGGDTGWLAVSLGSSLYIYKQELQIEADITEVVHLAGTAITLEATQAKKLLVTDSNVDGTITLFDSGTTSIGWQTSVQQGGDGRFAFEILGGSGDTLVALDGYVTTLGKGAIVTIIKTGADTWWIGGGLGV